MKKTLIALAVAASAVSGMAHAWTNGDFNGSVDIGGSITADDYRQKWSWAVGGDINGFNNALAELTQNRTKLTITVNGDKPILLGKTNEAFSAPVDGGVGAIPLISITDYENKPVTVLAAAGNYNSPDVFFDLAMKNDAGVKVGTVRVNAQAAGVAVIGRSPNSSQPNTAESYALHVKSSGVSLYKGGLPGNIGSGAGLAAADAASSIITKFGSLSTDELYQQVKAVYPSLADYVHETKKYYETMVSANGTSVKASSYALGIANGQTLEATFDQAVTASTQWSAPLNVAVTYN